MLDLDSPMKEEGPILCQEYARVWDSRDSINETQFNELVGELHNRLNEIERNLSAAVGQAVSPTDTELMP